LYKGDLDKAITKFKSSNPGQLEYEDKLKELKKIEEEIDFLSPIKQIGAMALQTSQLKDGLKNSTKNWIIK